MKKLHSIFVYLVIFGLLSCQSQTSESESSENDQQLFPRIMGEWQNLSLVVKIQSRDNNPDSSAVFEVPEGQWEEVLQIRPIVTVFLEDSTYSSTYSNLKDSVVNTSTGTWKVKGDSLYLINKEQNTSYYVRFDGNKAEFTGYIDWDQDGNADDLYVGVQKKTRP
jgi:hypothetical protein